MKEAVIRKKMEIALQTQINKDKKGKGKWYGNKGRGNYHKNGGRILKISAKHYLKKVKVLTIIMVDLIMAI